MKIWVIGRGYPTPDNKMWGSFELEQAKMLARNGYDVSFIALTLSFFSRRDHRGIGFFVEDCVKIHTYSHFYFPGKLGIYLEGFEDKCWRRLFKVAEETSGTPDIIHIHYPSMISSINEIEKYRERGVKVVVTEHWSRVLINKLKKHEQARLNYYSTHANCFVSVSKLLLDAARRLVDFTVPTEIVPNIVAPVFFEARGKNNSIFTFICIGRLVPLKQFDIVIREFLKEFAGNEKIRLKIIGNGPERKKLEQIADGSSQIEFKGELSMENTAKELANADVLISFSKYETFAAPVAEAWASGKPVIVSEESGVAFYANKDNGITVSGEDSVALGIALKEMYQYFNGYDFDKIKVFAASNFNDIVVMNKIYTIYEKY